MASPLFDHFRQSLEQSPEAEIIAFRVKNGTSERLSWRDLLGRAAGAAQALQAEGVTRGEILPIMRETGASQVCDFLAAILLGAIPCVLAPPNPRMAPEVFRRKLLGMLGEKEVRHLIADAKLHPFLNQTLEAQKVRVVDLQGISGADPLALLATARDQSRPLFLQHSSGTTGVPKAVMISEQQLLAQARAYGKALEVRPSDRVASWLPLYHDMGMVAALWCSLLWRIPATHMSNFAWALRPAMLLEAISEEGSSLCWLPNFAFSFMAKNVKEHESAALDLSSMRAFVSCSEPVYSESFAAFVERFAANGVKASQMAASYAMAENVFAITQSTPDAAPATLNLERRALATGRIVVLEDNAPSADGRLLASSGRVIAGVELLLRLEDGSMTTQEDQVGEFVVGGECVIDGYFGNQSATAAAIQDGRYRTGDLGFIHRGEVFVIGRGNDMIIVGGRNLDPGEVEFSLSDLPEVLAGRVACLGIFDAAEGTESVHVLLETTLAETEQGRLMLAVKQAVMASTSHQVRRVWCLPKGWLIKSSSGKIARKECKAKLLAEHPELA